MRLCARSRSLPALLGAFSSLPLTPALAQEPAAPALEVVARFPAAEEGVVVDSRTSAGGEAVPLFVRGGKSLLSFIWREDRAHLVVDGASLATFDEVFVPPGRQLGVDDRGSVTVLARRGEELCRVRWSP